MQRFKQHFSDFVIEDIDIHIKKMKENHIWGDQVEVEALSRALGFNYTIVNYKRNFIFQKTYHSDYFPHIFLEYINSNHYNALIHKTKTPSKKKSSILLEWDLLKMNTKFKGHNFDNT